MTTPAEFTVVEDSPAGDTCEPGQAKYTVTRRNAVYSMLCLSEINR